MTDAEKLEALKMGMKEPHRSAIADAREYDEAVSVLENQGVDRDRIERFLEGFETLQRDAAALEVTIDPDE